VVAREPLSYLRVSTQRQGVSSLGLGAQQSAIASYLKGVIPVAEFREMESVTTVSRPELNKALALCRKRKATLVIAKVGSIG